MQEPHRFDEQVLSGFRRWASSVGLVLEMRFCGFCSWRLSDVIVWVFWRGRCVPSPLPPPVSYEEMPVWHNVLEVGKSGQTYFSPKLVRAGKLRFYHLFGDAGLHSGLWKRQLAKGAMIIWACLSRLRPNQCLGGRRGGTWRIRGLGAGRSKQCYGAF